MELLSHIDNSRRRIAAVGMFDGVHAGHRFLLSGLRDAAAERGLDSCVVTFANHPLSVIAPDRAPRLLSTSLEKINLLGKTEIDSCIMLPFDERLRRLSAQEFMTLLRDEYGVASLMLGFNNSFGCDRSLSARDYVEIGAETGLEVLLATELPADGCHVSSSAIRREIASGDVLAASVMLGRDYSISGTVVEGKQLGRTIGFPTANIRVTDPTKLIPGNGVYAARAITADGTVYPAMVNIGHRPTVDTAGSPVSIEAHLIGLDRPIYGEELTLCFIRYMRPEQQFDSVEALKSRLALDRLDLLSSISERINYIR